MSPSQISQVRRLWKAQCGIADIRAITGLATEDIKQALFSMDESDLLAREAQRMLKNGPPRDWEHTSGLPKSDWPRVIQGVFADVLEAVG